MDKDTSSLLSDKKLMIIFTTSTAGLGHLRVTNALYHGLPATASPVVLGSHDPFVRTMHRLTSVHFFLRIIFEWMQKGIPEKIFSYVYKNFLRSQTNTLYNQVITLLEQRIEIPKTVLIVATHFGLAHQLGAIKKKLMQEKNINIFLVIQITDDSPQLLWYVPEADIIFVPSETTRNILMHFGKQNKLPSVKFEINPYPLNPLLSQELSQTNLENRISQLKKEQNNIIHVSIPVPGAAVGTGYLSTLIHTLHRQSSRFAFHVISKETPFTKKFLQEIHICKCAQLYTSPLDKEVVNLYEQVYSSHIISLEVTKPSEQAFKALFEPKHRGGSILLFAEPVGRQEYDNLHFLQRHKLIPLMSEHELLWNMKITPELHEKASQWRGLLLPKNPSFATQFIAWCLSEGVFSAMMKYKRALINNKEPHVYEIQDNGVDEFWKKIAIDIQPLLQI